MNSFQEIKRFLWRARGVALPQIPCSDDLYIVEFPKSGITWFSTIVAAVLMEKNSGDLLEESGGHGKSVVPFLNDLVPDLHMSGSVPAAMAARWPGYRVLKSHSKGNPLYLKVIYIVRHPRAVMGSYYDYCCGLGTYTGDFLSFVNDRRFGVKAWADHVRSWVDRTYESQRVVLLRYEDLKEDPVAVTSTTLGLMGVNVDRGMAERAVKFAEKQAMMRREAVILEHDLRSRFGRFSGFTFVNKARSAGDVEVSDAIANLIDAQCGEIARALGYP